MPFPFVLSDFIMHIGSGGKITGQIKAHFTTEDFA